MMHHKQGTRAPSRAVTTIGSGIAVAVFATTILTAQAAQASVTVGGTTLGGSGIATSTATLTPTIGSGTTPILGGGSGSLLGGSLLGGSGGSAGGSLLGIGSGSTNGSLIGIGSGTNGGVTGQVGNGLATVTLGGSPTTGGTGTVVVGESTPTPTASPTSTTTPTPAPSEPAAKPSLMRIDIDRSFSVVYPKKDGYRDSVSFLIDGLTSTGQVTAITGKASLTKGSKVIKTWKLTKSTQTIVWNGRAGKVLKTGKYVLWVTAKAATGAVYKASSSVTVSGQSLVKRTATIKTSLSAKTITNRMPKVVQAAYSKGKVYVQITTIVDRIAKSQVGKARLTFINGKKETYSPLVIGKHTSPLLRVPNTKAFRMVKFRHDWKKGSVKLRAINIVWSFKVLK